MAVDIPDGATPIEPGDPEEVQAVTQMGGTFAERAGGKAPAGAKKVGENSTFADRKAAREKAEKAVRSESDSVEDKSAKRTSGRAKKS